MALLIAVAIAFGPAQRARALQKRIEAREAREYEVNEKLREHTKEFEKEVNKNFAHYYSSWPSYQSLFLAFAMQSSDRLHSPVALRSQF